MPLSMIPDFLTVLPAKAWNNIDFILATSSSWYFVLFSNSVYVYFAMFTRAELALPNRSSLPNRLAWILFLVLIRLLHSSQNALYVTSLKELAKLLYLSDRSMRRITNAVNWDSVQNLCLAIKSMFSTTSCVCNLCQSKNTPVFSQWAVIKNRNYVL